MSGGGKQETTTDSSPWEGVQPYLTDLFKQAKTLSKTPSEYYPDSTVAPTSQYTSQYIQALADKANNGSATTDAANQQVQDTLSGKYLDSNPYTDGMIKNLTKQISGSVGSQFQGSGGYGGSAGERQMVAQTVSDSAMPYLMQNYNTERTNQLDAVKSAMGLDALGTQNLSLLGTAGTTDQAQSQAQLDDLVKRWNYDQQEPWQRLMNYSQLIQPGLSFGTSTSSGTSSPSAMSQAGAGLGAASQAAMMMAMLFA